MSWWLTDVCSEITSLQFTRFPKVQGPYPPSFPFLRGRWKMSWRKGLAGNRAEDLAEGASFFCMLPANLPPLSLLLFSFPHWRRCRLWRWLRKSMGGEKGKHRKRLWKSVYLGSHCSGSRPGTLDLLNHRSNVFPPCRPLNCVIASVLLKVAWYSLKE